MAKCTLDVCDTQFLIILINNIDHLLLTIWVLFVSICFFLSRWPTTFKPKVIQQCKALPSTSDLEELIHCAEATLDEEEIDDTLTYGSVFFSVLFSHLFWYICDSKNDVFK